MSYQDILYSEHGGRATITINRAKASAPFEHERSFRLVGTANHDLLVRLADMNDKEISSAWSSRGKPLHKLCRIQRILSFACETETFRKRRHIRRRPWRKPHK